MKTKWPMAVILGLVLATGSGCALFVVGAAAGAGAAGYAYVNGEMKSTESVPLDQAWSATLSAVKDLDFPVINQSKDAAGAQLTVRNASDDKIAINLKTVSDKATEIRIRVGTFGDKTLSDHILDKIRRHF
jgi:hypothetical protein